MEFINQEDQKIRAHVTKILYNFLYLFANFYFGIV